MMDKLELQKLRDSSIEEVARRLGIEVTHHKSLCPFHTTDKHPSMSYHVGRNICRCFVCMDRAIGPIDLVMQYLHLSFKEACEWLADTQNVLIQQSNFQSSPPWGDKRGASSFAPARYARFFEHPWLSEEAKRWLFGERRIDPRVVRWCRLTSWRDRWGVNWLQFPYYSQAGELVGVQFRNLGGPSQPPTPGASAACLQGGGSERAPRFRFPKGAQCHIWNMPVLNLLHEGDTLMLTEGCSDALSAMTMGYKALALPSASTLPRADVELLQRLTAQLHLRLVMAADNDVPGERAFQQLRGLLPSLVRFPLLPDVKDLSQHYLRGGRKEMDL